MLSRQRQRPATLVDPTDPGQTGVFSDPANQFAEIYGSAKVGEARMFVVAMVAVSVAVIASVGMVITAQNNVAIPFYVPVSNDLGVVSRPVRMENVTPDQAVMKAELGKWATKVFTIDAALTPQHFREANLWTKGLGTSQFTEFRVKQNVVERMTKDASLQRRVDIKAVDVSQPGIAFVHLRTQEAQGNNANAATASYRLTLKYERVPPKTEEEIQFNPLGIYITSMNVVEEAGK